MKYTVQFDGGTRRSNPGPGYGSYRIKAETASGVEVLRDQITRKDFKWEMTNNAAEYRTLISALLDLMVYTADQEGGHTFIIKSDSQLLVKQMTGEYTVKDPSLQLLASIANEIIHEALTGTVEFVWIKRDENVKVLGH